jgi:hypothetical protein
MAYLAPETITQVEEKLATVRPTLHKMMLKLPYLRFQHERIMSGYGMSLLGRSECRRRAVGPCPPLTQSGPSTLASSIVERRHTFPRQMAVQNCRGEAEVSRSSTSRLPV